MADPGGVTGGHSPPPPPPQRWTNFFFSHLVIQITDRWASEIRLLLCKFGFESVWLQQCVPHRNSFIANFREKLKEYYIERWQTQLKNSSKLAIYSTFKLNFGLESYLGGCMSRQLCITFARFRSSCLPLEIDNGRKSGLLVEERICKFCEAKKFEYNGR